MTEQESKELWAQTLKQITTSNPDTAVWFSKTEFGGSSDDAITILLPGKFMVNKFESDFRPMVEKAIEELAGEPVGVFFKARQADYQAQQAQPQPTRAQVAPAAPAKPVQKAKEAPAKASKGNGMLNPYYTFESFVLGDNSSFAYNACLAISKSPGSAYNPCLIYGGVGLGKTHLLQSIGNRIVAEDPDANVVYVTAENYTNEFLSSVAEKKTNAFKKKYRKATVLLIDDIHFLQGKAGTQEELFNTFNDLYDTNRQIVFTCDRPVSELKDISDRLRSRFSRGLNIDLLPPNYETRMVIVRKKCDEKHFVMSEEIVSYIAENVKSNVRDLEACITKLIAYSTLLGKEISLDTAREQLKQFIITNKPADIQIDTVIRAVASYFNVTPGEIKGKTKMQSIVVPRQVAMYLCRTLTDFSTTEIGQEFDGKNHTSVMYNVRKVESLMNSENNEVRGHVDKIMKQILDDAKTRR